MNQALEAAVVKGDGLTRAENGRYQTFSLFQRATRPTGPERRPDRAPEMDWLESGNSMHGTVRIERRKGLADRKWGVGFEAVCNRLLPPCRSPACTSDRLNTFSCPRTCVRRRPPVS
jgi:hypothetical protein